MTVSVVVCGRTGRMSRLVAAAVAAEPGMLLAARLTTRDRAAADAGRVPVPEAPEAPLVTDLGELTGRHPVVVDLTHRALTAHLLGLAHRSPCALVVGTSGLTADDRARLADVARERPVVAAANFSQALTAVARFVGDLSRRVGADWDAGVLDVHFAGKRDRPSATARHLAGHWRSASGHPGAEIASLRIGEAVGEHRVVATGPGEHVEVVHRVSDRAAFLPGILQAVRFAATAPAGLYTLEDTACPPA
ncbi:4-hydroxy-tetrahydrodipicolinate reductase [Streptomyces humi]